MKLQQNVSIITNWQCFSRSHFVNHVRKVSSAYLARHADISFRDEVYSQLRTNPRLPGRTHAVGCRRNCNTSFKQLEFIVEPRFMSRQKNSGEHGGTTAVRYEMHYFSFSTSFPLSTSNTDMFEYATPDRSLCRDCLWLTRHKKTSIAHFNFRNQHIIETEGGMNYEAPLSTLQISTTIDLSEDCAEEASLSTPARVHRRLLIFVGS